MPSGRRTWGALVKAVYDQLTELWPHRVYPMQVIQKEFGGGGRLLEVFFNYLDFHQVDGEMVDEEQIYNDNVNEFALHVFTISGVVKVNTTSHWLSRAAAGRLLALYRSVLEEMALGPDGDVDAPCLPAAERMGEATSVGGASDARVLDSLLRPVPVGVVGGLYVPEPAGSGSQLYDTGRLARVTDDGTVQDLGPGAVGQDTDGAALANELYRIRELLDAHPAIHDCFVTVRPGSGSGKPRSAAYVRTVAGAAFAPEEVRRYLVERRLPHRLIPHTLTAVDAWPLDALGNIDEDQLPQPSDPGPDLDDDGGAGTARPWDGLFETLLREALEAVSYDGPLTARLSLADSGMDSFGFVGLLTALEQAYGVTVPENVALVEMFRSPATLWAAIADLLDGR
jgi:acyl carrier protein